jgi:hypothetical protein
LEYASTACEPTRRGCGLASEHQIRPDQEGVSGGALRVVATNGILVSVRPRERGFLVTAGQVRGERELLEIVEIERRRGVRCREPPVRLAP